MLKIKPKTQTPPIEFSTVKVKIQTEALNNFNAALDAFSVQNPHLEAQNLTAFLNERVAILLKKATQQLQKKHGSVATSEAAFDGSEPSNPSSS